jgi:hypothetical protein
LALLNDIVLYLNKRLTRLLFSARTATLLPPLKDPDDAAIAPRRSRHA